MGGTTDYDEKVDVWARGVLLFELLAGKAPFDFDSSENIY